MRFTVSGSQTFWRYVRKFARRHGWRQAISGLWQYFCHRAKQTANQNP